MSQFCPMCNQITNCTENCKSCLEEELAERERKIAENDTKIQFYELILRQAGINLTLLKHALIKEEQKCIEDTKTQESSKSNSQN